MIVKLALLADYANVTADGKLNILGIFERMQVGSLPAVHPLMHFIVRLEARPAEFGRAHRLEIRLHDPDGQTVFDIGGEIVPQAGRPGETVISNQVIGITNLQFEKPGGYNFVVILDNDLKAEVPLVVDLPPAAPAGPTH